MSCQHEAQVQAYHDGELPTGQRDGVEQHLRECADCAALLNELRQLSLVIQSAPRAEIQPEAIRRLEQAWWRQRDRGVLRLAEWLTAAAAAILIGTLLYNPRPGDGPAQPGMVAWQTDALNPPAELRDDPASDVVAVAEWMANDLSDAAR